MKILPFLFCLLIFCSSCKKDKVDNEMPHLKHIDLGKLSSVRLINNAEYAQIVVNGDSLTNFIGRHSPNPLEPYLLPFDPFWSAGYRGTAYFPIDGYLGREWRIQQSFFEKYRSLNIVLSDPVGFGGVAQLKLPMDKPDRPMDYYLGGYENGKLPYFMVERDDTPPARAGYFKIRVINLSYPLGPSFGNPSGPFKDLSGEVTLTYADGTPVDRKTSLVNYSKRASEYIELPYGKYQFRILHHSGWQVPGTDGDMGTMTLDPPTSSQDLSFIEPNHVVYAPIHSYQPGGIYTIMIHPSIFRTIQRPAPLMINQEFQNAFRVIEDSRTPANTSYMRIQGFNALPGAVLQFSMNGKGTGEAIGFGKASGYTILGAGTCQIEAKDAQGKVLASVEYPAQANQNYTAWVYPEKDGSARISVVANDLSGENPITDNGQDNGAYGRYPANMPFAKRFLNLCPDIPYLTVTSNNGQSLGAAQTANLQPGMARLTAPYVWNTGAQKSFELMAYRSSPGLIPGVWADDIPVLHSSDFIANESLYTKVGEKLPVQEPGFYTVALIGRTGANVPAAYKARMIILKHNN